MAHKYFGLSIFYLSWLSTGFVVFGIRNTFRKSQLSVERLCDCTEFFMIQLNGNKAAMTPAVAVIDQASQLAISTQGVTELSIISE